MSKPDELGIPLRDALRGRFARLVGCNEPMFKECGPSLSVCLDVSHYTTCEMYQCLMPYDQWPGYRPWSRQIRIRDFQFRNPPGPITRSNLAKNVAKSVARFIAVNIFSNHRDKYLMGSVQEHQGRPMEEDGDPIWAVGAHKIEVNDLVLVRLDNASKNSWQAHLQLLCPRS